MKGYERSKATNAYELLADVRRAILAEPRRYDQGTYKAGVARLKEAKKVDAAPACGTMACVAGWCVALKTPGIFKRLSGGRIEKRAARLLAGFAAIDPYAYTDSLHDRVMDLFDGGGIEDFLYETKGHRRIPNVGTREYARVGARRIKRFMQENEIALKAVEI